MYSYQNRYYKPGSGYIEYWEVDFEPRCDDGSLHPDSAISQWWCRLSSAKDVAGKSIRIDPDITINRIKSAGFVDVARRTTVVLPWLQNTEIARERSSTKALCRVPVCKPCHCARSSGTCKCIRQKPTTFLIESSQRCRKKSAKSTAWCEWHKSYPSLVNIFADMIRHVWTARRSHEHERR